VPGWLVGSAPKVWRRRLVGPVALRAAPAPQAVPAVRRLRDAVPGPQAWLLVWLLVWLPWGPECSPGGPASRHRWV
jgi:hypothetical protein